MLCGCVVIADKQVSEMQDWQEASKRRMEELMHRLHDSKLRQEEAEKALEMKERIFQSEKEE